MSIDAKTRKLLWGRSGNRCVFCRQELIIGATTKNESAIVGEECHIISSKTNGPRYDKNYPSESIDSYKNLILLCNVHHKMIDDQCDTYAVEMLQQMKANHETWVTNQLASENNEPVKIKRVRANIPSHLLRIQTGRELLSLLDGCVAFEYSYDDGLSERGLEIIADFLVEIQDCIDIYSELDIRSKIRTSSHFDSYIRELYKINIWVFSAKENRLVTGGVSRPDNFPVLILEMLRSDNNQIMKNETQS